ncbi:unnamed protein product [Ilex paraguariensis]|uniref:Potassium channel n=1 Tax=Ilex paraguariensis TaxID=185542 RepID=A0ABC8TNP2_9AQUA
MLSHICLKFKTDGLKQQETLNSLPKAIRSSIAYYLFFPIVQTVHLFQGVSHDFLFQLVFFFFLPCFSFFSVSEMEAEYFPPKEDVILQNEAPTDVYILVSGAVDLIAHIDGHDQVLGKAVEGEMFGEVGVLCHRPQPFTVRTTNLSQILRLNRTTMINMIQANAEDARIILNNLFRKLKDLECFGSEQHIDLSLILSQWLDEGPKGESCSHAGDPLLQEVRAIDLLDSEARHKTERGKACNSNRCSKDVNSTTEDGQTTLNLAVLKGQIEKATNLLEEGQMQTNQMQKGILSEHRIEITETETAENNRHEQFKPTKNGATNCSDSYLRRQTFFSPNSSSYPADTRVGRFLKRRVTIHMKFQKKSSSQKQLGKLIILPDSLEVLFSVAGQKFGGYNVTKVVNSENAEIDDISVIQDGDHLFLLTDDGEVRDCNVT